MTNTPPRRRWFRYSLRTLLLLVTIASGGFGWLGYKMRQAQRQKEAVEAIAKSGGVVLYDYQIEAIGLLSDSPTLPGPIWLRNLLGVDFLANAETAHVFEWKLGDVGLEHIQHLAHLKVLVVSQHMTDARLVHFRGLSELESLSLDSLTLDNTEITDTGLVFIQELTNLKYLGLGRSQITDAGLLRLRGLKQLEILNINNTKVTDKGCQELQRALPSLKIIR